MTEQCQGKFISLEGGEGSGKTTQLRQLAENLRGKGYEVVTTREPGGTNIGDQIRDVIISSKNTGMDPRTETLLFQASRAQLVEETIRPALKSGKLVLIDRFFDSTLAYQGFGHGVDLDQLKSLIEFATTGLRPDLTLLLKVRPDIGLARKRMGGEWNRLDAFKLDFHKKVFEGFDRLVEADPKRWRVIDAERNEIDVSNEVVSVVDDYLRLQGVARLGIKI